jgi:hypothetical protein
MDGMTEEGGEREGTFMGCTGRGIPKITPVRILNSPENTKVDGRLIEPCNARAIMSGSRVPRSPRAPEISATGDSKSMRRLYRLRRTSSEMKAYCILLYFFSHPCQFV